MAAITPSVTSGEYVGATDYNRLKLRRFTFASIATADTFASNIHDIVDFAIGCGGIKGANNTTQTVSDGYSPNIPSMPKVMKAVYDDVAGAGTFTFTVTSGPATNIDLFVWSRS